MGKNGKRFIKPGVLNHYDNERKKNIAMNNMRLNALGLKRISASLFGPNKKGQGKSGGNGKNYLGLRDDDDDDYQLPEDEDEEEFSSSDDEEETEIVPPSESTVAPSHTQEPVHVPASSFSTPGSLNATTSSFLQAKGTTRKKRYRTWDMDHGSQPSELPGALQPTPSHGASKSTQSHGGSQPTQQHGSSRPPQPHRSLRLTQSHSSLQPTHFSSQPNLQANQGFSQTPSHNSLQPHEVEDNIESGDDMDNELFREFEVGITDESSKRNKRGMTRLPGVWNLPPEKRIIVTFNQAFQPVGDEGTVFNRFIGTIARKPHLCPINCKNWHKVPDQYKEDCWNIIQSKFVIPEEARDIIKYNTLKTLGDKLRSWKCSLKSKYFDPLKTAAQVVAMAPPTVNREHYAELVTYWYSKDGMAISETNKGHRKNQTDQHTAGSKTYAQHGHEMEQATGIAPSRTRLYIPTHTRKDGTPVNETAAKNIDKMNDLLMSQPSRLEENASGEITWAPDDVYADVIGKKERHGRVRGLGFGPTPKSSGSIGNCNTRFRLAFEEERMRDKETIRELQDQLQAQNRVLKAQNDEINTLKAQMSLVLRKINLQVQDVASVAPDQDSPQTN